MKITVLTDPPTVFVHPKRGNPSFGGTYEAISRLRRKLEDEGYEVAIHVFVPGGSVAPEAQLYRLAIAGADFKSSREAVSLQDFLTRTQFDALILALKTKSLVSTLPDAFQTLESNRRRPMVFVTAGPTLKETISRMADKYQVDATFLVKRGVARMSATNLALILEKLRHFSSTVTL